MFRIVFPIIFPVVACHNWRFQQHRRVYQARIAQQSMQPLLSDDPFAYTGVYIAMTSQCHLCVVEVDNLEAFQSNGLIKVLQHLLCRYRIGDIVPCSPQVGCIETDSEALRELWQEM